MIAKFLNLISLWLCELMVLDQSGGADQAIPDAAAQTEEGLSQPPRKHRV